MTGALTALKLHVDKIGKSCSLVVTHDQDECSIASTMSGEFININSTDRDRHGSSTCDTDIDQDITFLENGRCQNEILHLVCIIHV